MFASESVQVSDIRLSYRDRIEETTAQSAIEVTIELQPTAFGIQVGWQDTPAGKHSQSNVRTIIAYPDLLQHKVETEGLRAL